MSRLLYKRCGSMDCDPRIEELLLESKSGALQLEGARLRNAGQLEKLYLVAAVALLYGTLTGVTVQVDGYA